MGQTISDAALKFAIVDSVISHRIHQFKSLFEAAHSIILIWLAQNKEKMNWMNNIIDDIMQT